MSNKTKRCLAFLLAQAAYAELCKGKTMTARDFNKMIPEWADIFSYNIVRYLNKMPGVKRLPPEKTHPQGKRIPHRWCVIDAYRTTTES